MPEEIKDTIQTNNLKVPFSNILEILANKVSRKATVVTMAMVLIYLLAATPNVPEATLFIIAITGLAIFFTVLQYRIDMKDDKEGKHRTKKEEVVIASGHQKVVDDGKDT